MGGTSLQDAPRFLVWTMNGLIILLPPYNHGDIMIYWGCETKQVISLERKKVIPPSDCL